MLPGDGVLRFYRLAIPVAKSAFEYDFDSNKEAVYVFWKECEDFVNKAFVPLGMCFNVVEDDRLINLADLPINMYNGLPEMGNGTILLDGVAFTLTSFDPMDGNSFIVTDGVDEDETTDIMTTADEKASASVFDLQGRCVEEPMKGLYIVNGKKSNQVIWQKRGEHMYALNVDMTRPSGQVVALRVACGIR
jgi:hypothetical protein